METFLLGIKALFRIWGDRLFSAEVKALLEGTPPPSPPVEEKPAEPPAPLKPEPTRSEAITLLTVLQREARFVDFIKEPINEYTDAAQFRLTGNIPANGPFRGMLNHSGWKASRCEIPQWSGMKESALVIAPCEVELK